MAKRNKAKRQSSDSESDDDSADGSSARPILQSFLETVFVPLMKQNQSILAEVKNLANAMITASTATQQTAAAVAQPTTSQASTSSTPSPTQQLATSLSNMPIDLMSKGGVEAYRAGSTPPADWKPLALEQKNRNALLAVLSHFETGGFDTLLQVGTSGTGKVSTSPKTAGQIEVASYDVHDNHHMIGNRHKLKKEDVSTWSGWIHGKTDCALAPYSGSTPRVEATLDLSASGNEGLVANFKHQQRIRSQMMHDFIRAILTEASYRSLLSDKVFVEYERELDRSKFVCGLSILWLLLEAIKPTAVVDAKELEKIIERTTLLGDYKDDVRAYISRMRGALNDIRKKHGADAYADRRYAEHLFTQLKKSKLDIFRRWVEAVWTTQFLTNKSSFDVMTFEAEATEVYVGCEHEDDVNAPAEEDSKKIALLTQKNKTLQQRVKALERVDPEKSNEKSSAGGKKGVAKSITAWRMVKKGNTIRKDGILYEWCDKHKAQDGSFSGLYMRCNDGDHHNHELWLTTRKKPFAKRGSGKRKADDSGGDDKDTEASSSTNSKSLTPAWKKEKRKAFITDAVCLGMSDEQAQSLFEKHSDMAEKPDF